MLYLVPQYQQQNPDCWKSEHLTQIFLKPEQSGFVLVKPATFGAKKVVQCVCCHQNFM